MSVLSNELFFNVHRGIHPIGRKQGSGTELTPEPGSPRLGVHWSASPGVAKVFAGDNGFWGKGIVYHGTAPISAVETDKSVLENTGVNLDDTLHEKEITLKKGAKVNITGKDTIKERTGKWDPKYLGENIPLYRVRKRKFNPPREMQA